MSSLLSSTNNTRPILKNSLRYIRSDVPNNLSQDELSWLIDNNILTIIDLRSKKEISAKPCLWVDNFNFTYHNIPINGGDTVPSSPSLVSKSYLNMVDKNLWSVIDIIENSPNNVLFFCNAGKDRTGVVSAILLKRLNYSREYIISDYLQSANNLKDILYQFSLKNACIDINVITPQERYIIEFLDKI